MSGTVSSGRGASSLAGLLAAVVFAGVLSIETQSFAVHVAYSALLGKPIAAHWYFPGDTLFWMLRFDYGLDPTAHPRPWVHEWFAMQRTQLGWATGIDFALFIVLSAILDLPGRRSDVHGGAKWASRCDVRRSSLRRNQHGVILGQTKEWLRPTGDLLTHGGPQNVLGLGPPGEGKTDGIAVPTLLHGWLYWSAIVFDPAAELTPRTLEKRSRYSRIVVFDPRDHNSARFNPLDGIAADDIDAVRAIMASFLLERDLGEMTEQERFFSGSALELGTALALHAMELGSPTLSAAAKYYYDPEWKDDTEFFESLLKSQISYVTETASKFSQVPNLL